MLSYHTETALHELYYCLKINKKQLYFHSSHLVFLVSAEVSYAVFFKQLVIILFGQFFLPATEKTPQATKKISTHIIN